MSTNFENINLLFPEKVKLFCMRFKKHVSEKFLGSSARMLVGIRFVTATYPFCDITQLQPGQKQHTLLLTDTIVIVPTEEGNFLIVKSGHWSSLCLHLLSLP